MALFLQPNPNCSLNALFCAFGYHVRLYYTFDRHSHFYPQGFPQFLWNNLKQIDFIIF